MEPVDNIAEDVSSNSSTMDYDYVSDDEPLRDQREFMKRIRAFDRSDVPTKKEMAALEHKHKEEEKRLITRWKKLQGAIRDYKLRSQSLHRQRKLFNDDLRVRDGRDNRRR